MAKREPFQIRSHEAANAGKRLDMLRRQALMSNASGRLVDIDATISSYIEELKPILEPTGFADTDRIRTEIRHLMINQLHTWYYAFVDESYYYAELSSNTPIPDGPPEDMPDTVEQFLEQARQNASDEERAVMELEDDLRTL